MTILINKLNMSNNSQFLSRSRLTSFDHLRRWAAAINSSTHSVQEQWNNTLHPLLSTLPQTEDVNAWTNGLDGKALYVDRATNSSNLWFYNQTQDRPKSIKESIEDTLLDLDNTERDLEELRRKIETMSGSSLAISPLVGDATGEVNANTVEKIQSNAIASDAPSDGDGLVWSASGNEWQPTAVAEVPIPLSYPPGYICDLNLTYTAVDQVTVSAGICKSDDYTTDIELASDTLMDIDLDLDTGVEASGTWYYIWLFYDPTGDTTSLKFSIQDPDSGVDPTAPSAAYTKKRYLGSVRNDSSGNFLKFSQRMVKQERYYQYDEYYQILAAGNDTVWTQCIDSGEVAADYTPVTAIRHHLLLRNASSGNYYVYARGKNLDFQSFYIYGPLTTLFGEIPVGEDQDMEYKTNSASASAYVYLNGYVESI